MFLSISGQHTCLTLLLFSGGAGLFRHCGALVVHHSLQVRQSYHIEQHLPTEIPCLAVSLLSGLALLGLGSLTLLEQILRKYSFKYSFKVLEYFSKVSNVLGIYIYNVLEYSFEVFKYFSKVSNICLKF